MKITINGKEYESGKITRKKYAKFSPIYKRLTSNNKETYSEKELDEMVQAVTDIFGGQFTFEEAIECEELQAVAAVLYYFNVVNAEILLEMEAMTQERKRQVNQGKNLKAVPVHR